MYVSAVLIASLAIVPDDAQELAFAKEFFAKNCVSCHGRRKPKGGVALHQFFDAGAKVVDAKKWAQVQAEIHERRMPPSQQKQPPDAERERVAGWLQARLDDYRRNLPADAGRTVARRLNRTEYDNTVRDLFGVTTKPAEKFPSDGGGGAGFDNNAATLYLPPILMERYLAAAKEVSAAAKPERILLVKPKNDADAPTALRATLAKLLPKILRRPLAEPEFARYLAVAENVRTKKGYEAGVRTAVRAALASPSFLFRIEHDPPPGKQERVSDYELASRLSYFLWCSTPDDALLELASAGKLHEPKTLDAQVDRMLADPKARALAESFAGQWLGLRVLLTTHEIDTVKFPTYTPALRQAMAEEAVAFVHNLLTGDGCIGDLIDADYTYLNETLAKHYGVPNVKGQEMRRVELADRRRGGVITMASVLTLSSYARRTSPVLRGKWVLEELLGTPPPPPPPIVQTLPADDKPVNGKSLRARLEIHRQKAECAGCHAKLDPLGFGLENFDSIGAWRTEIAGQKVDSGGTMATGEKFSGPVELKELLTAKHEEVTQHFAERLLGFALGRGVEPGDTAALAGIVEAVARADDSGKAMVNAVVRSLPFQHRRGPTVQRGRP